MLTRDVFAVAGSVLVLSRRKTSAVVIGALTATRPVHTTQFTPEVKQFECSLLFYGDFCHLCTK